MSHAHKILYFELEAALKRLCNEDFLEKSKNKNLKNKYTG